MGLDPVPAWKRAALGLGIAALALVLAHLASGCGYDASPHECRSMCAPRPVLAWSQTSCTCLQMGCEAAR